jgi:pimeloyl-ACP methyl ester carboxylesterase
MPTVIQKPTNPDPPLPRSSRGGFKLWHLVLLVAFAALGIADIQDHRVREPVLIGLAAGGFAAYAILAWLAWCFALRFEGRLRRVTLVGIYLASMAGLFLVATVAYLVIEFLYLGGRF